MASGVTDIVTTVSLTRVDDWSACSRRASGATSTGGDERWRAGATGTPAVVHRATRMVRLGWAAGVERTIHSST